MQTSANWVCLRTGRAFGQTIGRLARKFGPTSSGECCSFEDRWKFWRSFELVSLNQLAIFFSSACFLVGLERKGARLHRLSGFKSGGEFGAPAEQWNTRAHLYAQTDTIESRPLFGAFELRRQRLFLLVRSLARSLARPAGRSPRLSYARRRRRPPRRTAHSSRRAQSDRLALLSSRESARWQDGRADGRRPRAESERAACWRRREMRLQINSFALRACARLANWPKMRLPSGSNDNSPLGAISQAN